MTTAMVWAMTINSNDTGSLSRTMLVTDSPWLANDVPKSPETRR